MEASQPAYRAGPVGVACVQTLQSVGRSEKEKRAPCRVCATATNSLFEFSDLWNRLGLASQFSYCSYLCSAYFACNKHYSKIFCKQNELNTSKNKS